MSRQHLAVILVTATIVLIAGSLPAQTVGSAVRNERIASSILRRKAASGASVRTDTLSVAQQVIPELLDSTTPLGEVAPPPALEAISGNMSGGIATPITDPAPGNSVVSSSSVIESAPPIPAESYIIPEPSYPVQNYPGTQTTESYPVTQHQPYLVQQADAFATGASCSAGCGGCDSCSVAPGCGAASYGGCDGSCGGGCSAGGGYGYAGGYRAIDSFSLGLGVVGFKNMVNRGESGSFGFQESFNWGTPLAILGMNSQIGFRATQSDFNGSDFTANSRAQYFVTAGLYKRNYNGWQGGCVFDYLHDDWYTTIDLGQIRGELSYAVPNGSSVGLLFATSVAADDTSTLISGGTLEESWESHDSLTFFYKVQSNQNRRGSWRVFVGFTGESDGLIGSDMKIPLAGTWSLEPEFTYLIPDEATGRGGNNQEAWNVGFNLVWYPGRARGDMNFSRLPLIDVAGNGTMITRRK